MADPATLAALKAEVAKAPLPRHVGVIMDGNGRWAESRGLARVEGHRVGSESVRAVTRTARQVGVPALSLYAFSSQNWERPPDEVAALMDLLCEYLVKERGEILDNAIRLTATGDLDRLPRFVREPLDALCAESARNDRMVLNLALSYGGREEIIAAARSLARHAVRGEIAPEEIGPDAFVTRTWTAALPDLDLVIRTSGELRISNFMLWRAAYAELYFTPCLWPDFREEEFLRALVDFQRRERRFGQTPAQVARGGGDLP